MILFNICICPNAQYSLVKCIAHTSIETKIPKGYVEKGLLKVKKQLKEQWNVLPTHLKGQTPRCENV